MLLPFFVRNGILGVVMILGHLGFVASRKSPLFLGNLRILSFGLGLNNKNESNNPLFASSVSSMSTAATSTSESSVMEIYPLSPSYSESEFRRNICDGESTKTIKIVHFIRHAEGTHNVEKKYNSLSNLDARLTKLGEKQCENLAEELQESSKSMLENVDLVVTSPLTRCVQTALQCFPTLLSSSSEKTVPCVALECIRETVNYNCDRRRSTSELMKEFPNVNFDDLVNEENDPIWKAYEERLMGTEHYNEHRESAEIYKVAERGRLFFSWLAKRNEKEIIVSTHSAFLRCILNWGLTGRVPLLPPQHLDQRSSEAQSIEVPILRFCGDAEFETKMRSNYDNCELRSFLLVIDDDNCG